jgi:hypothetical protein
MPQYSLFKTRNSQLISSLDGDEGHLYALTGFTLGEIAALHRRSGGVLYVTETQVSADISAWKSGTVPAVVYFGINSEE